MVSNWSDMNLLYAYTICVFALPVLTVQEQFFESLKPLAYEMNGELNMRCRSKRDCRRFGYVCRANKTCQCDQWYIPNADRTKCLGGVDQKCLYDEHCIEGAYCQNQLICKCKATSPVALDYGLICAKSSTIEGNTLLNYLLVLTITMNII